MAGLTVQFGLLPKPEAVNCCVCDGPRRIESVIGAVRVMFAVAVCAGFAILTTVSTIVCAALTFDGAVYSPFAMLPTEGASAHVTAVLGAPPMEALN
jgi:hypothetical protein